MIKNWPKKRTYILVAVIAAVFAIYGISYFTIIKPLKVDKEALATEVSMYENQLDKLQNQTTEDLDDELLRVADFVPNEPSPDSMLININNIASSANVNIDNIASSSELEGDHDEEDTNLQERSYALDVEGRNLKDINSFMDKVITSDRLMRIDTVNIEQTDTDVYLTLTVTIFYKG
ncbi:type 4a pilus biogenesis protein PilO [Oceanobacillus sp. Castelsardo]|uniref:type 4a pilus biogenesis protein PilO n=1 Tax=Oceanobacillus sp. Castelsardo TaxID=1851204 RepID=UPI0008391757|nr:type 4a pilus biogenesis protein PilO [Oceanobacillus sp. Castelsardo]